ncbi:transferase [Aureococcus anophagefferens]|nr:transferase [Aureococcus anophagefferens]
MAQRKLAANVRTAWDGGDEAEALRKTLASISGVDYKKFERQQLEKTRKPAPRRAQEKPKRAPKAAAFQLTDLRAIVEDWEGDELVLDALEDGPRSPTGEEAAAALSPARAPKTELGEVWWNCESPAPGEAEALPGPDLTMDYSYEQYVADFHKIVPKEARERRAATFAANLETIVAHNAKGASYVMGVNKRRQRRQDQGGCGSCWAFASTATMESHVAIETGTLFQLSPQELVSCMPNPKESRRRGGCGRDVRLAFQYYVDNGGVVQEFQMGYTSYYGKNGDCYIKNTTASRTRARTGRPAPVATISGFEKLPVNEYAPLMRAVATKGPVAVSVDASWGGYESGIFETDTYDSVIDHAVVLVGYGTDEALGKDYWLVRNSWGPTWGEKGYIRLRRHAADLDAYCGVDTKPLDGVGCAAGPANMTTCGTSGILSDSAYPVGGRLV